MSERQQAAIDERTANRLRSNAELSEFVDAITPAVSASDPEAFGERPSVLVVIQIRSV